MAKSKKVIQQVEVETFEYVNVTDRVHSNNGKVIPQIMFFTLEDNTTAKVKPGESVYFTQRDIERHKTDSRFIRGLIRPVGSKVSDLSDIRIRNDMTEQEIDFFVENCEDKDAFISSINKIDSVITLNIFSDKCEKHDRPISFIRACEDRIKEIEES